MARYTGAKRRLSRREGVALFTKDAGFIERKGAIIPGFHGVRRARKLSEYGIQLREKQKAKRMFGLLERQFSNYVRQAEKSKGNTGEKLLSFLEMRLDNIVYRLSFSTSRAGARQLVSHGHVSLDNKKVTIPSVQVKEGQTVAILGKMSDNTEVRKSIEASETLPAWLDKKATVGKVLRLPERSEMEQGINEQLIVEYYSR